MAVGKPRSRFEVGCSEPLYISLQSGETMSVTRQQMRKEDKKQAEGVTGTPQKTSENKQKPVHKVCPSTLVLELVRLC